MNKTTFFLGVLAVCASFLIVLEFSCKAPQVEAPDAQSGQELIDHLAKLDACQLEGRDSGKYSVYEACKAKAGVK